MIEAAERTKGSKPSVIRELLKEAMKPGMTSLAAGNPSVETFPVEEIKKLSEKVYAEYANTALSYGATEGYAPLCETLAKRYREKYNSMTEEDTLQIFSGGQQAIDLITRCFVNAGDTILCEERSYTGALCVFRSYHTNLTGVPMDENGIIPEELEKILKEDNKVKMLYTISTFQNPSGITLSEERRKKVYELAVKYDIIILEDSPYFELRYSGEYIPTIKSFDTTGHVFFVGSVSKIFAPGLRIGFVICKKEYMRTLTIAKQTNDMHTNIYAQILADLYFNNCDVEKHIQECCDIYRRKRDVMMDCIDKTFPKEASHTVPDGGLFLWVTLPENVSGYELCNKLLEKKIVCVPGGAYLMEEHDINALRLNFSVPSIEQIEYAIPIVAETIKEMM